MNGRSLPTRAGISSFLALKKLKNPDYVKKTGQFKLTLYDEQNNKIAQSTNLNYTANPGVIDKNSVKL